MRDLRWKILSSEYLFKETWFTVRKDICEKPDGKIVNPYYVFEFPEWATAFPITEDGKIIMVRQYRQALGEVCIEFPVVVLIQLMRHMKMVFEESYWKKQVMNLNEVHYLGKISANPSTNTNLMHMFIAKGGKKIKEQELDHNEDIEVMELTMDEVLQLGRRKSNCAIHAHDNHILCIALSGKIKVCLHSLRDSLLQLNEPL